MLVRRAVITAAAQSQRALPLQTLIDADGKRKSLLQILIEQSLAAGVDEIAGSSGPEMKFSYAQAAGPHGASVRFVPQPEPRVTATPSIAPGTSPRRSLPAYGRRPPLREHGAKPSAQRLVELAQNERCSVSGVQPTRESLLCALGRSAATAFPRAATFIVWTQ